MKCNHLGRAVLLIPFVYLASCGQSHGPASLIARDSTGYEVGNGGTAVVCRAQGKLTSIELLDFYMAKIKWRPHFFQPALGSKDWTVQAKVAKALTRLARLDPERATQYQHDADTFFSRSAFVSLSLPDTKDYGDVPLPSDCRVEQLVVHKKALVSQEVDFLIDDRLLGALSSDAKAGLALHEVIYLDAIRHGQKNSLSTRSFTALVASNALDDYDKEQYERALHDMGLSPSPVPTFAWPHTPWVLPYTACVGLPFQFELGPYLNTSSAKEISFVPAFLPSWLALSSGGVLEGIPDPPSTGPQKVVALAKAGNLSARGEILFEVMDCLNAPIFKAEATSGDYFQFELPYLVGTRFYSKISGPRWLSGTVGSALVLGRPSQQDVGLNHFVFRLFLDNSPSTLDFELEVNVAN